MNLKKNDKIILIVGVVNLIVAGAGIALYSAPSSDDTILDTNDTDMEYKYTWTQRTGSKAIESPMVDKGSPFERSYSIESASGSVLTQVMVNIDWKDDNTFGLLRTKGADTLTVEVSLDGKSRDESSELEGNHSFSYNVNSMPKDGAVDALSSSEAASKLKEEFMDENTADFDVTLNIETGEPWWRLLQNFKDKGNTVDISVEYTYYTHELLEPEDEGDDTKTTGDDGVIVSSHQLGEFYVNLGHGRGMI